MRRRVLFLVYTREILPVSKFCQLHALPPPAQIKITSLCALDYPDCGMKGEVGEDGNITSQLVSYTYWHQVYQGKSVHRSAAIVETGCQKGYELISGYKFVEFPLQLAYVAHVRNGRKPHKC